MKFILEEFEVPIEDGTGEKYIEEREKAKEKDIKEDNKEFAARTKIADEINTAKADKVKEIQKQFILPED